MKRKVLAIIGLALMCSFAATPSTSRLTPAFAEEESSSLVETSSEEQTSSEATFVEKTYVYEDENGKATLVLLSESEFSMTVGEETKFGTYTKDGNVVVLTVGENSLKVVINEILGTFGEYIEEEPVEEKNDFMNAVNQKFNDLINTFVVPLISSVSLASVLSMGFSFFLAMKNRGTNKKIKKSNEDTQAVALKCIDLADKMQNKLLEDIKEYKDLINEAGQLAKDTKAISEETSKKFDEKMEQFEKSFEKVLEFSNKLQTMGNCIIMLIQLQSAVAKSDPKAISSGVIEQIDTLNEQAKKLL